MRFSFAQTPPVRTVLGRNEQSKKSDAVHKMRQDGDYVLTQITGSTLQELAGKLAAWHACSVL